MLIKCAFVGQKALIFIEMHCTTTMKITNAEFTCDLILFNSEYQCDSFFCFL
jgi:hypothetical protein